MPMQTYSKNEYSTINSLMVSLCIVMAVKMTVKLSMVQRIL